jgi:hypothetical protein
MERASESFSTLSTNSPTEMELTKRIVAQVERGEVPEDDWAYSFDMEKSLTAA